MADPHTMAVADSSYARTTATGSNLYSYYSPADNSCSSALLIEEMPLMIACNGVNHAVMMISPLDVEDFVTGFALTEGIVDSISDLRTLAVSPSQDPAASLTVNLHLEPECFKRFLQQQRSSRRGASGCGLCGSESFKQVFPDIEPLPQSTPPDHRRLNNLRKQLAEFQQLGQSAGGIHAALLLDHKLNPILCREDIGRHNALDKVIGAALKNDIDLSQCSVLMSSRCSTELVLKAARSRLPNLIHLSSPSTLAVNLAEKYGISLIHIPRSDGARFYSLKQTTQLSESKSLMPGVFHEQR